MSSSKKRRSSSDGSVSPVPVEASFDRLGLPFCTPRGMAVTSEPLYSEFDDKTMQRFRQLVHCQGTEWWLHKPSLASFGITGGWIFTDAPPMRWSFNVSHRVVSPVIFPFLHRRDLIVDLRQLRYIFHKDRARRELLYELLLDAESYFNFDVTSGWNNPPLDYDDASGEISRIDMCHGDMHRQICSSCGKNRLIVCRLNANCLCNKCARRVHATLKLCQRVPVNHELRQEPVSFSAFVDGCLTVEENMRGDVTRVLDYSSTSSLHV